MNRVAIEYFKAGMCGLITLITVFSIYIGGGPRAYSFGILILPVLTLLFTGFFCWTAEYHKRQREQDEGR